MKKLNGIHLAHNKNTADFATKDFPLPKKVCIPMSQAMGASCDILCKKGDIVSVGEIIGESTSFVSVPVHSSVSGTIVDVIDYLLPNGKSCKAAVIETDGLQTMHKEISPVIVDDRDSFIAAVRSSGLPGLGGAGFPTHVKINFDSVKTPIDTLIINAAECEPYITSDNREILENPSDIIEGILLTLKYLGIPYCKICIENNKPEAIKLMREKTKNLDAISVVSLPSIYPQGAEKVIIYSATGRIVAEGELPSNQNVIVMNVSTVAFIHRYISTGVPLVKKRITLDGDAVLENRGNFYVPVGTYISDIIEFCKADKAKKVLYGGPMMGMPVYDFSQPILKTTNAILAFLNDNEKKEVTTACIRCGSCISACPLNLSPVLFESAYKDGDWKELEKLSIMLCMNCGCCSYVCPAKRHLAEVNQLAKGLYLNKRVQ